MTSMMLGSDFGQYLAEPIGPHLYEKRSNMHK